MISGCFCASDALDGARDFFADDGAHRPADETKLHRAADHRPAVQLSFGGEDGVFHAEFLLRFFQARARMASCR